MALNYFPILVLVYTTPPTPKAIIIRTTLSVVFSRNIMLKGRLTAPEAIRVACIPRKINAVESVVIIADTLNFA